MFAFTTFTMQPAYGQNLIALSWNVLPQYTAGKVFVYRSTSGSAPWTLLNDDGVPAQLGYYVDNISNLMGQKRPNVYYRLALEVYKPGNNKPDVVFDSEIINIADKLSNREQRTVSDIMRAEFMNMQGGNGIMVWMFAPLMNGEPVPGFDFQTKQMQSTGMQIADKASYGEAFVGGFGKPLLTWIQLLNNGVQSFQRMPEGPDMELHPAKARFLAYPRPLPDYLIVLPARDDRYIVGRTIEPFLFRGIIPVGYEATMVLLPRTDPRYKLPVPPMPTVRL